MELPILNNFLVPVDGGESSRRAKRYAVALAQKCGAKVILFYAHGQISGRIGGEDRQKVVQKNLEGIDKVFAIYEDGFKEAGVEFETVVASGEPSEAIIKAACEHNCGMIIMGAKGQTGMRKVLGSVASKVSSTSPIPVLVVGTECDCTNSCGKECMWKWRFEPVPNLQEKCCRQ
ncbi:universal stress protein [Desulfovibrio subterraneus]|jgi:nucleotide-binding universal stress UspA family protein|uniref:Universal stress protein n=1 Tax=Desulfovibrio subterraneus TaxID=2718620 RepID=A0A7J0BH57_9BACT|nr:universal stress protein [Desulfovibrio subterraneus]WBF67299.1 universal stress protein [Desulfovibrio subterraneus]GFM33050.1 universal stress protein [Desulfovibrio subterraneus]